MHFPSFGMILNIGNWFLEALKLLSNQNERKLYYIFVNRPDTYHNIENPDNLNSADGLNPPYSSAVNRISKETFIDNLLPIVE